MKTLEDIKQLLMKHKSEIKERFGVKNLYIFGSYVRGEQTPESDIDILVEFEKGKKTFRNYMGLKFYLEELFEKKVDLVIKEAVRKELKKNIYGEAINV
ncbi:nucleotidyltransferase family protein [Deferribacter thermophilus]|uniref:nucleotidyltransferase family protein n=1 Tax=Deferribacter thermophilus TaxID=53573 RepID=UPI003C278323